MLADVHALAGDIGPRGTGTTGEYVAGQLVSMGLPVDRHSFRAVASQNAFPLAIDGSLCLRWSTRPLDGRRVGVDHGAASVGGYPHLQ